MKKTKKRLGNLYIALIFIFMYAPIVMLIIQSFNMSKSRGRWGGATLQWYAALFEDEAIMEAFRNTIVLALLSALIAVVIGTAAAIALAKMRHRPRQLMLGITNIPMLNADIVTGVALMLFFMTVHVQLGFGTVLLSHVTFNIPYVILNIMPRFRELPPHIYEAAQDLGAGPVEAFFKVIFPEITPGVISGGLMAFTMSIDDFIITYFTTGSGFNTLSTKIYAEVKLGIRPEIYALSSIIFVTVLVLLLLLSRSGSGKNKVVREVAL